jgi:hypothetical protein
VWGRVLIITRSLHFSLASTFIAHSHTHTDNRLD